MASSEEIALIKALRERTGAGIMDCKKALIETGNDIEKAVDYLREKGIAKQAKRAGRTAAEGLTNVHICEKCGKAIVLEINCETDFVANSDTFKNLLENVTKCLMQNEPASLEEAKTLTAQLFTDAALAVGEKLELRRFEIIHPAEGQKFASYSHMGGKIGTLVLLSKPCEALEKPLAMHIAANAPIYISLEDVPAADRARERAIAEAEVKDDPKLQGKPEAMLANIIEKKTDKALQTACLVLQDYLLDPSKKVGQVLKENGVSVVKFVRYQVGEGIVKTAEEE